MTAVRAFPKQAKHHHGLKLTGPIRPMTALRGRSCSQLGRAYDQNRDRVRFNALLNFFQSRNWVSSNERE